MQRPQNSRLRPTGEENNKMPLTLKKKNQRNMVAFYDSLPKDDQGKL
jgi:hypothetical protein